MVSPHRASTPLGMYQKGVLAEIVIMDGNKCAVYVLWVNILEEVVAQVDYWQKVCGDWEVRFTEYEI